MPRSIEALYRAPRELADERSAAHDERFRI
jgi:hypothetical protein